VLLRPSGTEPVLRVMVERATPARRDARQSLAETIARAAGVPL
jgi:phosphomannomutase